MQRITLIGLGIVGTAWAKNLHADGLDLRTWNRTPKKDFPGFEPDLVKAVTGAEVIHIVVADPPAVAGILDAIEPHLRAGQLVIQSSTISAAWTKKFCAQVESRGARFLEAPFTGGQAAAEARKTVYYVGGSDEVVELGRPILSRLSQHILHIGGIGSASSLKLAMNLNLAVMAEALCESLTLARGAGIPDEKFFAALEINSGRSAMSDFKKPKLEKREYSPQFSLKHMNKDMRLALETAGELNLPLTRTLKSLYEKGMQKGMAEEDFVGVIRLIGESK
jgi:3-hydroxyisobutyrate dehydrogenase-like beta-hydroxyacid dehydrogenase